MQNKVILEGELARKPYIGTTSNGNKKANIIVKVDNYYIDMDSFNDVETIEKLKGGETLSVTGSLKKYKSNKYDTYLLAINVDTIKVVGATPKVEEKVEEPFISYDISMDDLPF